MGYEGFVRGSNVRPFRVSPCAARRGCCYDTRSPLQERTSRNKTVIKVPDGAWIL